MNRLQKLGGWILGGVVAIALFSRQKVAFGIKQVLLGGVITTDLIPLRIVGWLSNSTIATVLVRSISAVLISSGQVVASINQPIFKRIAANSYIEQDIYVDIHNKETLSALFANVQSGNVNNLAFELQGEIVIGEQWPVGMKFSRLFTWQDIQQIIK